MRNFRQSLTYLRPYLGRIALIVAAACGISLLWAGGLGAMVPGAKVLISPEGFHGWAYRLAAEDRLGCHLAWRNFTAPVAIGGRGVAEVLEVVQVSAGGPAQEAGIRANDWLLLAPQTMAGTNASQPSADANASNPAAEAPPSQGLARQLAAARPGEPFRLWMVRQPPLAAEVTIAPGELRFWTRGLLDVAAMFKEPATYAERFPLLLWLLAAGAVLTLLRVVLQVVKDYLVTHTVLRTMVDIRCDLFQAVLGLPSTHFSKKGASETLSRFYQDVSEMAAGQATLLGGLLTEPARAIAALAVAMALSWKMTLLVVLAGPPMYYLARRLGKAMRMASGKTLETWSDLMRMLKETLFGIRVVKLYTAETALRRRFLQINRRLMDGQMKMGLVDALVSPAVELIGFLSALGIAAGAGYLLLHEQAGQDVGGFLALIGCLAVLFAAVQKTAGLTTRIQRAEAAATRIRDLMETPGESSSHEGPPLPRHRRDIEFRHVDYRYDGTDRWALQDVNLTVQAGELIAVVGPNGAGKTTLVSLLPGLLKPTAGCVLIDGHDISRHSLRSLRRQIAMVSQDDVVFHGTVAENIALGVRHANRERLLEAAAKAFVDEFVRELPDGYDTVLSEGGQTLSGGQRQRITIARAILRDPAILIFDEAMSQVDSESERRIRQAMARFVQDRTTLVVAHRFATVRAASRIVVLDQAHIVDVGSHDDLMGRCELYRTLYLTQFQDTSATKP